VQTSLNNRPIGSRLLSPRYLAPPWPCGELVGQKASWPDPPIRGHPCLSSSPFRPLSVAPLPQVPWCLGRRQGDSMVLARRGLDGQRDARATLTVCHRDIASPSDGVCRPQRLAWTEEVYHRGRRAQLSGFAAQSAHVRAAHLCLSTATESSKLALHGTRRSLLALAHPLTAVVLERTIDFAIGICMDPASLHAPLLVLIGWVGCDAC
jgi:hypothetical protein